MRKPLFWHVISLPVMLLAVFFLLPVFAVMFKASGINFWTNPAVVSSLKLSIITSSCAALVFIVLGVPAAYFLARVDFKGKKILGALLELPMVLPPSVAGLALLMTFGRLGLLGKYLNFFGISIPFSTSAVVMAQVFVAGPIFLKTARNGFAAVNPWLEKVSFTLGKSAWSTFCTITLPLALPSLISGLIMAWARALGEFGATIMFAGNLPGKTQTLPLAIFSGMERNIDEAVAIAALMLLISFAVLFVTKIITGREDYVGHSL